MSEQARKPPAPADAAAVPSASLLDESPTAQHLRVPNLGAAYLEQARRQFFARHPDYLPYLVRLLDIQPGMTVVEVGCGTGAYTRIMASRLGGEGRAIGVDAQPALLAQAHALAQQEGWGALVQFGVGEPAKLPLMDGAADRVFCNSLLWRLGEPAAALGEMRRVLRPGARALAAEPDGGLVHSYIPDRPRLTELEQRFQDCFARGARVQDGYDYDIGRRLPALFLAAGFVAVRAYPRLFVAAGCDVGADPKEGLAARLAEYQQALRAMLDTSAEAQAARDQRTGRARAGGMSDTELAEYERETQAYLRERIDDPRRILSDGSVYMYGGIFCEGLRFESEA
jgi:SAM-dependent methyltransferase